MRHSEQLEKATEETRQRLARSLDELRVQVSADHLIDDFVAYTREGPVADFLRNLAAEVRDNPLPLLVTAAGLAWLIVSSSLKQQARAAARIERREPHPDRPIADAVAESEPEPWAVVPVAK